MLLTSLRRLSAGMVFAGVLAAPAAQAAPQTPATTIISGGTLKITVNDPRPVARVVNELEQLCRCAITYEDVRFSGKRELVEVPAGPNGEARTLIPRGGHFEFSYDDIETVVYQRVPGVLTALLHKHSRSEYPGRFVLRITGTVFHVVPAGSAEGPTASRSGVSLLDAPIQFESTERTLSAAVQAVNEALIEATGQQVRVTYPVNLFESRQLVVGANAEPARDVLLRILAASNRRLSWRLLYDAGVQTYTLNMHIVPDR